ncbi:MAG TPA: GNAT family N-acetyltransferase [Chloroflexia bacterium]|nr:GNAT family N-acetyltransferase [Chloroflexia bacterium]
MTQHPPPAGPRQVQLRDVTTADLPCLFAHQQDPVATQMAAFPARDRRAFMAHWTRILADPTIVKQTILVDGQVAGHLVSWDQAGAREVGYWLGRAYWGQGVATQALAAFLRQVPARPLYAYVAPHNHASRRVLEKCGFTVCGADPEAAPGAAAAHVVLILRADAVLSSKS